MVIRVDVTNDDCDVYCWQPLITTTDETYLLRPTWYLMLMGSAAEASMRPYLTSICRVCSWMNSLTAL